jgi:hypothetical protein
MGTVMQDGIPVYDATAAAVDKTGTAHTAAEKQAKTFQGTIETLKATLVDLGIKIGNVVLPVIQTMIGAVTTAVDWLMKNKAVAEALAVTVGTVLSLAIGAFVVDKMAKFIGSVQSAYKEIGTLAKYLTSTLTSAFTTAGSSADTAKTKIGAVGAASTATATETDAASSDIVAKNAAVSYSFAGTSTAAEGATTKIGLAETATVGEVGAADTTIEADNVAAGASFTAMLGPIAAVGAAILGYNALATNYTKTGNATGAAFQKAGSPFSKSDEANWLESMGNASGGKHGAYPWATDNQTLLKQATAALDNYGTTGDAGIRKIIAASQALAKEWPQDKAQLDPLIASMQKAITVGDLAATKAKAVATATASPSATQGSASSLIAYLKTQGFTQNAAAGIAGNIGGGEDGNWKGDTLQGGAQGTLAQAQAAGSGFGLVQWTDASRQAGLAALAKKMGKSPSDVAVQYAYIAQELSGSSTKAALNSASSPQVAALIAAHTYEAPADQSASALAPRAAAAAQYAGAGGANAAVNAIINPPAKAKSTKASAAASAITVPPWLNGMGAGVAAGFTKQGNQMLAAVTAEQKKQTADAKAAHAKIVQDSKAGNSILNGLLDANQTKSLSSLNTQLNISHTKALGQMVEKLDATHKKGMIDLGKDILAQYQTALNNQTAALQAAAALAAQQEAAAAYAAMVSAFQAQATAYANNSSAAGSLYGAGATLGVNTAAQSVAAQEMPLAGHSGADLMANLANVVSNLESGNSSQGFYQDSADYFGRGNSALGTDFQALASGTLSGPDADATLKAIESLISQLVTLDSSLNANTTATTANTTATAAGGGVNTIDYVPVPTPNYDALRPILTAP